MTFFNPTRYGRLNMQGVIIFLLMAGVTSQTTSTGHAHNITMMTSALPSMNSSQAISKSPVRFSTSKTDSPTTIKYTTGRNTTEANANISAVSTPKYISQASFNFNYYFNFLTQTLVRIFGITTNILNFIILSHRRMRSPTNMLLVGLAVADIGNLIIGLPFNIWNIENSTFFQRKITFPWQVYIYYVLFTFSYGFITAANWLTVSLSVYRYIAVCHPYKASSWCTYGRTKSIIAVVFSLSFLIFIENFFNVKPEYPVPGDPETYRFVPGPLLEPTYVNVVNAIQIGLSSYLPWLCSFCFSMRIIHGMRQMNKFTKTLTEGRQSDDQEKSKERDEQERRVTIMLISIVMLYLLCSIPTSVRYIIRSVMGAKAYYNTGMVTEVFDGFANFCIALNSALNFLLYSATNEKFRAAFLVIICRRSPKGRSMSASSKGQMTLSTATLSSAVSSEPVA